MDGSDAYGLPIDKFFRVLIGLSATELVMQTGLPASFRIKGDLSPLDMPPMDGDTMRALLVADGQAG
ncbi:twitching motility protein [Schlesneria paludicola]|uniref:twitching motility protein n=1 Tax=Schlesneria paludicola TaxID=360056 RepID=UPI00029AF9EF|nr:twitching motility protein [Schlesneria paludicola]